MEIHRFDVIREITTSVPNGGPSMLIKHPEDLVPLLIREHVSFNVRFDGARKVRFLLRWCAFAAAQCAQPSLELAVENLTRIVS